MGCCILTTCPPLNRAACKSFFFLMPSSIHVKSHVRMSESYGLSDIFGHIDRPNLSEFDVFGHSDKLFTGQLRPAYSRSQKGRKHQLFDRIVDRLPR